MSIFNRNKNESMETPHTKETGQQELQEKFGMSRTSDFSDALFAGKIEEAEAWLQHIVDNKKRFPQYHDTWESWLKDRQTEIARTRELAEGEGSGVELTAKEAAQKALVEKFGMRKTSNFQDALKEGRIEDAEAWLQYIVGNKGDFPQYHDTWDSWLSDRERELAEAKKS